LRPLLREGRRSRGDRLHWRYCRGHAHNARTRRLGLFCHDPGCGSRCRRGDHLDRCGRPDDRRPRLVPGAATIPEISYREAAELAHFGAKVLHPKTISAVTQCGIPLWIRNTFSPERPGTRITPAGPLTDGGVKGLTAISDVALITVGGAGIVGVPDVLGRTFATTAAVRANVLLISQSSSQNDICLVVASSVAERTLQALRREFAQDLAHEKVEHITLDPTVAIVTVVGKNMRGSGTVGRTFTALGRENLNIIAIAQGSSECNISFVVSKQDVKSSPRYHTSGIPAGRTGVACAPRPERGREPRSVAVRIGAADCKCRLSAALTLPARGCFRIQISQSEPESFHS
jgi:predicted amino acid-binding ACT domain protein